MTASEDLLQPLLDATALSAERADPDALRRLWALVGDPDPQREEEFLDAISPEDAHDEGLPLRVGQWTIDLTATAVRTGVLTALVAGVLIPHGLDEFAVGFVTAVLPTVIDIERVQLTAGDRRLLVELRAKRDLGSEEELYKALPRDVRRKINRYDFADFIERLRNAGFASGPAGGPIQLRAP